jgi:uncharacterized protein with FMN-binding domain
MLDAYEQHSKRKLIAIVVAVIVIAGVVVFADQLKAKGSQSDTTQQTASTATPADNATTTPVASDATSTPTATSDGSVKDGTYTATSNYQVPHGEESIKVNVTLSGGTVTAVSIQNSENDRDSEFYQEEFTANYKSAVVGKKISGLQISSVSGASDTTDGFNQALEQIASQAQA